jgi:hypothetical protein
MSKSDAMLEAVDKISHVVTSYTSVVYLNIQICSELTYRG